MKDVGVVDVEKNFTILYRPRPELSVSFFFLGNLDGFVCAQSLSRVQLFVTPCTVAHQAPLSIFPRQEYWSGLTFPSPGDRPNPGIELLSPALVGGFFTTEPPGKLHSFPNS